MTVMPEQCLALTAPAIVAPRPTSAASIQWESTCRVMSAAATQFAQRCRKIVAVGRNFAAHAKELNNPIPKSPLLFLKPPSCIITKGQLVKVPPGCTNLHHEVELGVIIGKRGTDIPVASAMDHVSGYLLCLDMTARELQEIAKKKGEPWSTAKGYDTFCPISDVIPRSAIPDPQSVELWLKVNGTLKQHGNTSDQIFDLRTLIAHISTIFSLEEGDLILTGTPEGVGPVKPGDVMTAGIKGLEKYDIEFGVTNKYPASKL